MKFCQQVPIKRGLKQPRTVLTEPQPPNHQSTHPIGIPEMLQLHLILLLLDNFTTSSPWLKKILKFDL